MADKALEWRIFFGKIMYFIFNRWLFAVPMCNRICGGVWKLGFYVVYLLGVIYCVVAFVGTWRSAARYEGNKLFAILARFVVVLGFFSLISNAYYGLR